MPTCAYVSGTLHTANEILNNLNVPYSTVAQCLSVHPHAFYALIPETVTQVLSKTTWLVLSRTKTT